jgi:rubrerythrin
MQDELTELLDTAIYKEVASQAFYSAGQKNTDDPGARALMKELAEEEQKHIQFVKIIKEKRKGYNLRQKTEVPNLKISEYLTGIEKLDDAGLQETLIFAMKREQQSLEFYSRLMSIMSDKEAKKMCEQLVHEELRHKLKLETFYDDLFYSEN